MSHHIFWAKIQFSSIYLRVVFILILIIWVAISFGQIHSINQLTNEVHSQSMNREECNIEFSKQCYLICSIGDWLDRLSLLILIVGATTKRENDHLTTSILPLENSSTIVPFVAESQWIWCHLDGLESPHCRS